VAYRVTDEEIQAQQREFKKHYPPFKPFKLTALEKKLLAEKFSSVLITQNGMDTDDYSIIDGNKVEKYLGGFPNGGGPKNGEKVLILGTGTGREVLVAKEMGFEAVGTTLGSRNVYFGQHMLGLTDDEIIECANEVLPFPNETFDAVVGIQVFEHAMNPFLFLLEVRRVLKYDGLLMFEWPPAEDYHMGANPHHQICFCPGQAESLFQKAGFENMNLFYSNMESIPEDQIWSAKNHGHMICINGWKSGHEQPFMQKFLGVK